jgi:hypothetical protein
VDLAKGQTKEDLFPIVCESFLEDYFHYSSCYYFSEPQNNDDFRDEVVANLIRQKPLLFPFNNNQFMRSSPTFKGDFTAQDNSIPMAKSHRLQIRDGKLKFFLNDGSLRTARGFGKRSSLETDPVMEK